MKDQIRILVASATVLALAVTGVSGLRAGSGGCAHCGRAHSCELVCRLVREEKKVEVTCWGVKCEPFCLPGHSKRDCKHHDVLCDECNEGDEDISTRPQKFVWYEWIPGCAKVHSKKKLMKKTVAKKVPSYKWVVEDICEQCQATLPVTEVEPGAIIPPQPALVNR